jgi:hypothetical protein
MEYNSRNGTIALSEYYTSKLKIFGKLNGDLTDSW